MFDHILVPLDGSATAEIALPAAAGLAAECSADIELIHVLCDTPTELTTQIDPLLWHMRKAEMEIYLSSVGQRYSKQGLHLTRTILEGTVAERIISRAATQDVDLIVLSSHGRNGISSWNVSSMAHKIIARANRSIMLIRAFQPGLAQQRAEPFHFRRLLVPLDGSRRAEGVLPIVNKLATAYDASVWLIHVATPSLLNPTFRIGSERATLQTESSQQYEQVVANYLAQKKAQMTCTTNTALMLGDAVISTLSHFAQQKSIDLMLLSAHGRSRSRQAFGSVVTSAINHGGTSLFIFQDLSPSEIEPTRAESAAIQQTSSSPLRINQYAQPAFWAP